MNLRNTAPFITLVSQAIAIMLSVGVDRFPLYMIQWHR